MKVMRNRCLSFLQKAPVFFFCCFSSTVFCASCGVENTPTLRTVELRGLVAFNVDSREAVASEYAVYDPITDASADLSDNGTFTLFITANEERELLLVSESDEYSFLVPALSEGSGANVRLLVDSRNKSIEITSFEIFGNVVTIPPGVNNPAVVVKTPVSEEGAPQGSATPPSAVATQTSEGSFSSDGTTTSFGIPTGISGNVAIGRRKLAGRCSQCHGEFGRGWRFGRLKTRIAEAPMYLILPNRDLADIVAYLNRGK
jgi:hypothetical protein